MKKEMTAEEQIKESAGYFIDAVDAARGYEEVTEAEISEIVKVVRKKLIERFVIGANDDPPEQITQTPKDVAREIKLKDAVAILSIRKSETVIVNAKASFAEKIQALEQVIEILAR